MPYVALKRSHALFTAATENLSFNFSQTHQAASSVLIVRHTSWSIPLMFFVTLLVALINCWCKMRLWQGFLQGWICVSEILFAFFLIETLVWEERSTIAKSFYFIFSTSTLIGLFTVKLDYFFKRSLNNSHMNNVLKIQLW